MQCLLPQQRALITSSMEAIGRRLPSGNGLLAVGLQVLLAVAMALLVEAGQL